MPIRAAIFDFDGVILDTEHTEFESWREIYAEHGCTLGMDVWAGCIGRPWGHFDPYAHLEGLHGAPIDREGIRLRRRERVNALNAAQPPRPGVVGYIEDARRLGLRIGLASSSERWWVDGHLGQLGLLDSFDATKCWEDTAEHKPLPGPYLAVLETLGVGAAETIAFEDSPNGVTSAKAAGILTVAIPNRVTAALPLAHADHRLQEFSDVSLEALLARLGRQIPRSSALGPSR